MEFSSDKHVRTLTDEELALEHGLFMYMIETEGSFLRLPETHQQRVRDLTNESLRRLVRCLQQAGIIPMSLLPDDMQDVCTGEGNSNSA